MKKETMNLMHHKKRVREGGANMLKGFTLMLVMTLIMIGCDSIVDQNTEVDSSIATGEAEGAVLMNEGSTISCIDPDAGEYHVVSDSKTVEWGNRDRFTKTVDIEYYNTLTEFVLRVKSTEMIADVLVDDESIKDFEGTVAAGDWQEFTFDLDEGGTQSFSLNVAGSGPPADFEVDYELLGECVSACGEGTFTYNGLEYGTVTSANDRCWLDRNLGATKVAEFDIDAGAYGDYFTFDQAVNACPVDFRLATDAEWEAERLSWGSNNAIGAINSPLKLTMAGARVNESTFNGVGTLGYYWSSVTISDTGAKFLIFGGGTAGILNFGRMAGLSVRCIKEDTSD